MSKRKANEIISTTDVDGDDKRSSATFASTSYNDGRIIQITPNSIYSRILNNVVPNIGPDVIQKIVKMNTDFRYVDANGNPTDECCEMFLGKDDIRGWNNHLRFENKTTKT